MAATFTTIMAQTTTVTANRSEAENIHEIHTDFMPYAPIADFNSSSGDLKSSVEAKNCKARARLHWKMLRNVIRNIEFPKIKLVEERMAGLKRNAPILESDSLVRQDFSSEWVLQLQDFWEQSAKARQRLLEGRGPKKAAPVHSRSMNRRIRMLLNSTPSILEPGSNFIVGWALVQAILLLYITIVVPFSAVFLSDLDCFPAWSTCIDLIIDTYFIADILINAASPFKMQSGKMERHLVTCAKRYIRQQLLPDVILSIPVAWLQVGLSGQIFCDPNAATDDVDSSVDSTSLSLVRLPRLLRILRLLRIMKVLKLFDLKIFDVIKHIDPNVIALGKIMCFVIVFCHFLACIWWLVKRDDPDIKQWYDQLNVPYPGTPVMEQYVSSLYFIITTLTTVGYGDIHGTNDNERVFLVCVMFGGTLIFATIISSASQIVANLGASSNRHNAQLKNVFTFCKKWNIPGHQSNLVIDYCDAVATVDDENMAWDNVYLDLPHSIQSQITIAIVKNFFANNPLLSKASTKFLCVFFALVKQIAFLPSQILCEEGSSKEPSIYFIKSGVVRLFVVGDLGDPDNDKPGTVHIIKDYAAGEMVGLVSTVLWQPSLGTAISVGQTHCFVLPQSQLLALFRSFPDFERDLLDFAMSQFVAHTAALKSVRMHEHNSQVIDEQPNTHSTRRLSINLQSAISHKPAGAKVVPVPQPPEPPTLPADSRALDMIAEAEKNTREQKLHQSCLQLSKLLSEANFEEMLLVVEGVNGKDRAQLVRAGTLSQMQHAMLVMKQLVLLHGVPSDVKVSSVIDETVNKGSGTDQKFEARQFSWKSTPGSESSVKGSRTAFDTAGAQGSTSLFSDVTDFIPKFSLAT